MLILKKKKCFSRAVSRFRVFSANSKICNHVSNPNTNNPKTNNPNTSLEITLWLPQTLFLLREKKLNIRIFTQFIYKVFGQENWCIYNFCNLLGQFLCALKYFKSIQCLPFWIFPSPPPLTHLYFVFEFFWQLNSNI